MLNRAEVDLNKLVSNAAAIKEKLGGAKFNAVVKADAYGHGAAEVASAIYSYADSYSVALPEEGVLLRQSGIDKDILVLTEPNLQDLVLCARYNLTITVSNVATVKAAAIAAEGRYIKAHVKYNTGMNRYGANDIKTVHEIYKELGKHPNIYPEGFFTHLRAPEKKTVFNFQLNNFLLAYQAVKGYNKNTVFHVSASGGFLKGAYFDMCRIGLLLYGYKPFPSDAVEVEPIMRVFAPAVERRYLKNGEGLLYGVRRVKEDMPVSIIRYGYADGLPRAKKKLMPANRCMDVSAYKGVYGEYPVLDGNADAIAKQHGTIAYEILCNAARRAERVYLK